MRKLKKSVHGMSQSERFLGENRVIRYNDFLIKRKKPRIRRRNFGQNSGISQCPKVSVKKEGRGFVLIDMMY